MISTSKKIVFLLLEKRFLKERPEKRPEAERPEKKMVDQKKYRFPVAGTNHSF